MLSLKEKQLAKFSEPDQILIRGESDGRVGTKADSITQDRKNLDFLREGYELDTFTTHRNNEEVSINNNGEKLIQLCIASNLGYLLNGRTRGYLEGYFTHLGDQGCSTVDLVLASKNIFEANLIQSFPVPTFTTFHQSVK